MFTQLCMNIPWVTPFFSYSSRVDSSKARPANFPRAFYCVSENDDDDV